MISYYHKKSFYSTSNPNQTLRLNIHYLFVNLVFTPVPALVKDTTFPVAYVSP